MTTIGVRELYRLSRREWVLFMASRYFMLLALVLNVAMLIWNLFGQSSYGNAAISGTFVIMLTILLVRLHRQTARHRRQYKELLALEHRHLDRAIAYGFCPDCAELSLDENLTCRRIECRSRFRRDPLTKEWTRDL